MCGRLGMVMFKISLQHFLTAANTPELSLDYATTNIAVLRKHLQQEAERFTVKYT